MFKLEALQARHGECLLLHWGSDVDPHVALIDGGPDGTYARALRPRLAGLARARQASKVHLDLVIVSHIDDDHIAGILDLADDIEEGDAPATIGRLWHNSLEGLIGRPIASADPSRVTATLESAFPSGDDPWMQKVIASVSQGRELHQFAQRQGLDDTMNDPFQPLVVADSAGSTTEMHGLSITVVCPHASELDGLRAQWARRSRHSETAAYTDRSPYNLSSIVLLVEYGGRRMLLTGDARGDRILHGLEAQGLLTDGRIDVDVLKLPHHGSRHNVERSFFERVTAKAYVVSGDNDRFPNPHVDAMTWLSEARGDDEYHFLCTYDLAYVRRVFGDRFRAPTPGQTSIVASCPRGRPR